MTNDMLVQMLSLYFRKEIKFYKGGATIHGHATFVKESNFEIRISIEPERMTDGPLNRVDQEFRCSCYIVSKRTQRYLCYKPVFKLKGYDELIRFLAKTYETDVLDDREVKYDPEVYDFITAEKNPIKEKRYVNDITFSTRLLSYIEKTEEFAMSKPHYFEEFEYLLDVAKRLRDYQEDTATTEDEINYFSRLKD